MLLRPTRRFMRLQEQAMAITVSVTTMTLPTVTPRIIQSSSERSIPVALVSADRSGDAGVDCVAMVALKDGICELEDVVPVSVEDAGVAVAVELAIGVDAAFVVDIVSSGVVSGRCW